MRNNVTLGQHMLWSEIYKIFGGSCKIPKILSEVWVDHTSSNSDWRMSVEKYRTIVRVYTDCMCRASEIFSDMVIWDEITTEESPMGTALVHNDVAVDIHIYDAAVVIRPRGITTLSPTTIWYTGGSGNEEECEARWKTALLEVDARIAGSASSDHHWSKYLNLANLKWVRILAQIEK